jgi:hypothetical protein
MRRRVAAAAEEVVGGARSLTEIALDYGFDVQDTFARAFRRCYGMLPSEARRMGGFPRSISRTKISRPYVQAMLSGRPQVPEASWSADMIVEGTWHQGNEAELAIDMTGADGMVAVFERDGSLRASRALVGTAYPADGRDAAPAFPLSSTRIAGGKRARFMIEGAGPSGFALEFAYRAWLPSTGSPRAPLFDIIETRGKLAFLDIPLD